jgi:hypothetical protein
MKVLWNALIVIVVLVAGVILARNFIIRESMERGLMAVTGLKLTVDNFDAGLFAPVVSIKGVKLYNPAGFPDGVMIDVPEVYCEYKPMDILKGQISLKTLAVTLNELDVVSQGGQLNVNALKALQPKGAGGPPPKFTIDDFTLNINKVSFKSALLNKDFNLNISDHYTNVSGANQLVQLIISSAVSKTSIAGVSLSNITQKLPGALMNGLSSGGNVLKNLIGNLKGQ